MPIIHHAALWTPDLERLKTFYEAYFGAHAGARYTNPQKRFTSYFLDFDGGARLEIMHRPDIPPNANDPQRQASGLVHLAFATGSAAAVEALTRRLLNDGFSIVDGPRWTGDGYYESVVLDPDGNRVEITI